MENKSTRLRQVKKWGNSLVVVLTSVDVHDLGIKEGDWMDIADCFIISDALKKIKDEQHGIN